MLWVGEGKEQPTASSQEGRMEQVTVVSGDPTACQKSQLDAANSLPGVYYY